MRAIFTTAMSLVFSILCLQAAPAADSTNSTPNDVAAQTLISTFDTGNDGWNTNLFGEAAMFPADWDVSEEAIRIDDYTDGDIWQFTAPWSGNLQAYFGAILCFDLKDQFHPNESGSGTRSGNVQAIQLISRDWAIILDYPIVRAPKDADYTSYSVHLSPGIGWRRQGSTLPPTRHDFELVLSNLGYVRIAGEYVDGDDTCYLDNVSLQPQGLQGQVAPLGIY